MRSGRYVPEVHTGTEEQRVVGLLTEYVDIESDGMMREFAKDRETRRIIEELRVMNYEMWGSFDSNGCLKSDEEWLMARKFDAPHESTCRWSPTYNECQCANPLRARVTFYEPVVPVGEA